jgi:group I intron endonuclease
MIVYALVNSVNSKVYIGQTKQPTLSKRWNANLSNVSGNGHFDAALRKYGPQAFSREILGHCHTQTETDNLERLWIHVLRSHDWRFGYNQQLGGLSGTGGHTEETKRRIAKSMKKAWARKTSAQRREFAKAMRASMRRVWRRKSAAERQEFADKLRKALAGIPGRPAWNRGMIPGPNRGRRRWPKTEEAKRKISESLKRYYQNKRDLSLSPRAVGTKSQPWEICQANSKQISFTSYLKREVAMTKEAIVKELTREVTAIIAVAVQALEKGQSTTYARSQLKEVERRLKLLEFEYRGGCSW